MLCINTITEGIDRGRDHSRPQELPPNPRFPGGPGIGARRDFVPFVLALDAPRQDRKQHHPPDQEEDRERGGDRHAQACSSSTRVPAKSLGCRNSTGLPWAPVFGSPSPSTRAPPALSASRAARMSETS